MKSICIVVNKYPNKYEPYMLVFVQQLAWGLADQGLKVSVICPLQVSINIKYLNIPYHTVEYSNKENCIDIYWPKTVGLGQSHYFFGRSPIHITTHFLEKAAERVIRDEKIAPDVMYGHFFAPSGVVAARLGRKMRVPVFIAVGETHDTISQFGSIALKRELEGISGVIAVSSSIREWIISNDIVERRKIIVIPNGYNENRFKKYEKEEARRLLGLPQNAVIASFVGSFDNRKGVLRVCEAGNKISNIKMIFAGKGDLRPTGENTIFAQEVFPEQMPYFYSAADFFVLPTLNEGCCNAIIEAMACGLPIISSDRSFNADILSNKNSIRINPQNVKELETAMIRLSNDESLRTSMSEESLIISSSLTLTKRVERIIDYIENNS